MTLTADAILDATDPVAILGDDPTRAFRRLAALWHPDHNADPRAPVVLAHLLKLREAAQRGVRLPSKDVETVVLPNGALHIDHDVRLDGAGCDRAAAILAALAPLSPDLAKRLPVVSAAASSSITFARPAKSISMAAVLRHFRGTVPQEHVAWMVSRLYEVAGEAAAYGKTVVAGLVPESMLVLTEAHGVLPLDWRFAVGVGARMTQIPGALASFVPADKRAVPTIDTLSIHRLALILLGDPSGIGNVLLTRTDIARPFLDWFRVAPVADPVANYHAYRARLETIFGKPKYHQLEM